MMKNEKYEKNARYDSRIEKSFSLSVIKDSEIFHGEIRNLSLSGAQIFFFNKIPSDDYFCIQVDFGWGVFVGDCRTVYVNEKLVGVRFVNIEPQYYSLLFKVFVSGN